MKFGLNKKQYDYIYNTVVIPLQNHGATVWCYGSRARGDYHQFSDLDLMVESDKDVSKNIFEIQEKLTKSNFPYKVDLVELNNFSREYLPNFENDKVKW